MTMAGLDLRENIDGIVEPKQFQSLAGERAVADAAAFGVRHETAALHTPGNGTTAKFLAEGAEIHIDQIGRAAVQRHVVAR